MRASVWTFSEPRSPLHYDKPEGWREKADQVRDVVFEIADGAAEVGILALPRDGGGLLRNVNRWRGQIRLPEVDEAQLRKDMSQFEVAGTRAQSSL